MLTLFARALWGLLSASFPWATLLSPNKKRKKKKKRYRRAKVAKSLPDWRLIDDRRAGPYQYQ